MGESLVAGGLLTGVAEWRRGAAGHAAAALSRPVNAA